MDRYELAERIWPILVRNAGQRQTVTYGQLAQEIGTGGIQALRWGLEEIAQFCEANGYPPLTCLAVNESTRKPGEGFWASSGDLDKDQERVCEYQWRGIRPRFRDAGSEN